MGFVKKALLAVVCLAGTGLAQQAPPAAKPAVTAAKAPGVRPVFENERVRVLEVVWGPGAAAPAAKLKGEDIGVVGVVLKGGTLEHTLANGKKVSRERKRGDVLWEAGTAQLDARQNTGADGINIIQARVKKQPPTKAYKAPVAGARKVFENASVAVFDFSLAPAAKLPTHKYAPRLWVVMDGGRVRSTDPTGKKQEALFRASEVLWLDAQEQVLENVGPTPVRVISVEMK
jgi:hypothetical protein